MSKYNDIPASACTFAAPLELRDNGDGATTAPFELLARSSKPIEHWFWGNVIHDSAGFFGKERIPIDYNHDEVIGFANKRRISADGVHLSGALVSVKEGDRADMVMKQSRAGIPFEASINFGGDGIKIEEVAEGRKAMVNGFEFAGPGIIIREWPLRGCAFTPFGADGNTNTNVFSDSTNKFRATIINQEQETAHMESPDKQDTVLDESALAQVIAVEDVAAPVKELSQAVEVEAVEVVVAAVEAEEAEAEPVKEVLFTQADLVRMVSEFGQEIALQTVTNGGTYEDARQLHAEAERAELLALRAELAELKAQPAPIKGAQPASFTANDTPGKPAPKPISAASVRRTK